MGVALRYKICLIVLFCAACGGTLTDEQRKKLKEGMASQSIRKLSEAQITDAAFEMGRLLAAAIEKIEPGNHRAIDSLQRIYKIKIQALAPGDSALREIEKQIVEAYTSGSDKVQLDDNIQKLGTDSLLYTKPILKSSADGSLQFSYALGIRLSRKQVVLSMKD